MDTKALSDAIAAVAPINGISIGNEDDKATWRIDFKEEATDAQKLAAENIISGFNAASGDLLLQVDAIRDGRFNSGFADETTGKTYSCDPISVSRWTAVGAAAGLAVLMNQTPTFQIITADNLIVTLTAAEAFGLLQGRVMPWFSATAIYARQMKDAILAGKSPADITVGWP